MCLSGCGSALLCALRVRAAPNLRSHLLTRIIRAAVWEDWTLFLLCSRFLKTRGERESNSASVSARAGKLLNPNPRDRRRETAWCRCRCARTACTLLVRITFNYLCFSFWLLHGTNTFNQTKIQTLCVKKLFPLVLFSCFCTFCRNFVYFYVSPSRWSFRTV